MPDVRIVLEGDGAFPDAEDQDVLFDVSALGRLPRGVVSGRAAVVIEFTTPTGLHIYGQTSLALLNAAVRAMLAAEERNGVTGY